MIVTIVPYTIFPPRTGGQKGIALFTRHLAARIPLLCVTVKSNEAGNDVTYPLYPILSNSPLRYANLLYFFTIRKLLIQKKATHLITEHPYYGWLAILLQWFTPVKMIVHSHNIESMRWKDLGKWWWRILYHYEKWVHRQARYNLFITDKDRLYAIAQFGLSPARCMTAAFGIALTQAPAPMVRLQAGESLRHRYAIPSTTVILLFNGIFSYPPNALALTLLLEEINPLLIQSGFDYRLIICGMDIPVEIAASAPLHCICAGFVEDIDLYLAGADIFLNPITTGGGIKTKLVEALAFNLSCVSFRAGATGVSPALTGSKLHLVADDDIKAFSDTIIAAAATRNDVIPDLFFQYFNWDAIAASVEQFIHS